MANLLPDFKPGPLDFYRKRASFDWKKLKVFLDSEDMIKYQNGLWEELQNNPAYSDTQSYSTPDLETQRHIAFRQVEVLRNNECVQLQSELQDLRRASANVRVILSASPSSGTKYNVSNGLLNFTLMNIGTERHSKYFKDIEIGKIRGCYCLTEIGHGSNARGMRTTATYDRNKKVFVLNSPDFEAAKCWSGNLGQSATHGIVYAQLIIDGVRYGLHAFFVPMRHPNTLLPYPGLTVADMGEKLGLNGLDNGVIQFHNYEIPRENLLNKLADVTEDGKYVAAIRDPNKRHGASLGSLSGGRIHVTAVCETLGIKALTIAIRYSAVRRQFGPSEDLEVPILEYQSHQYRLLPYLAAAYTLRIFNNYFSVRFLEFSIERATGVVKEDAADMGMEIHALSSACKPLAGWTMKEAIQESRECCGGHGYLKVSGIGDLRNDHDANLTYEGENHVLIQQTSNWLLRYWPAILKKQEIASPLESINFLSSGLDILNHSKFGANSIEEMCNPEHIIRAYQWLVCYLLKRCYEKSEGEERSGKSSFWAKNYSQVFYLKTLAIVYIQHFFLKKMVDAISKATDPSVSRVLSKLLGLYGLFALEKHLATLYQGGYAAGPQATTLIQDSILRLCTELKNDAVSLIDAVAPPDFFLSSALGQSDGMVYKHLESAILQAPNALTRPRWWKEITGGGDLKNKL